MQQQQTAGMADLLWGSGKASQRVVFKLVPERWEELTRRKGKLQVLQTRDGQRQKPRGKRAQRSCHPLAERFEEGMVQREAGETETSPSILKNVDFSSKAAKNQREMR